jgi:SnoaL-like domain
MLMIQSRREKPTRKCTIIESSKPGATPALPQQIEPSVGSGLFEKMQTEFADAYNRKDVPAMAAFFSENAVRITPAGIFRGREAIGRELQRVSVDLGLHDYSAKRTVSRLQGNMVFNAGEWQAILNITAIIEHCWYARAM